MIKKNYPEHFERLWRAFDEVPLSNLGEKGAKNKAFEAFQAKKINEDDTEYLINKLQDQIEAKQARRLTGEFVPQFQHLERWIRNERFDDQISKPVGQLAKSDQRKAAAIERFKQRMAADMDKATGNEIGV